MPDEKERLRARPVTPELTRPTPTKVSAEEQYRRMQFAASQALDRLGDREEEATPLEEQIRADEEIDQGEDFEDEVEQVPAITASVKKRESASQLKRKGIRFIALSMQAWGRVFTKGGASLVINLFAWLFVIPGLVGVFYLMLGASLLFFGFGLERLSNPPKPSGIPKRAKKISRLVSQEFRGMLRSQVQSELSQMNKEEQAGKKIMKTGMNVLEFIGSGIFVIILQALAWLTLVIVVAGIILAACNAIPGFDCGL